MSSTRKRLRDRLREDLRSGSVPVIVTGIVLALPMAYVATTVTDSQSMGFLTLITVGILVPHAHEHYWRTDGGIRDVVWTVIATVVSVASLLASYYLLYTYVPMMGQNGAAIVAFLLVTFGGFSLLATFGPAPD